MRQKIFETREKAQELLEEAIKIWRQSPQSERLEGLEKDPVMMLLMSAVAFQANDIDNDEIIDLLEKTPVVNRDQKIKARLKEMQENATTAPVRKPELQQAKKGTATTIDFGS